MVINSKHRQQVQLRKTYIQLLKDIKSTVSFITYISILKLFKSSGLVLEQSVKVRHATKIAYLDQSNRFEVSFLDSDKIVVNLSKVNFSDAEVNSSKRMGLDQQEWHNMT